MNVTVDKLKNKFLSKVEDLYNADVYFVDNCSSANKYSLSTSLKDLSLQIYFEKNNYIILNSKIYKYIDPSVKRKVKLTNISSELSSSPDTVNNYIIEDKWEQIDW